ncbi:MAG: hypothetical protein MZV70_42215 [Desulfobacterales bacterium]|nr:hypothetical protein [Desulfobacterales bacterium]
MNSGVLEGFLERRSVASLADWVSQDQPLLHLEGPGQVRAGHEGAGPAHDPEAPRAVFQGLRAPARNAGRLEGVPHRLHERLCRARHGGQSRAVLFRKGPEPIAHEDRAHQPREGLARRREGQTLFLMQGLRSLGHDSTLLARHNDGFVDRVREAGFAVSVMSKPFFFHGEVSSGSTSCMPTRPGGSGLQHSGSRFHHDPLIYTRRVDTPPGRHAIDRHEVRRSRSSRGDIREGGQRS